LGGVTDQEDKRSDEAVQSHFVPGPSGGQVCNLCRCVVRTGKNDGRAHLDWHDRVEGRG